MNGKRVSQVQVSIIFVDEFDAVSQEGPFPFQGDAGGTAVEKAQDFLSHLPGLPEPPGEPAEPNRAQRRRSTPKTRPAARRRRPKA